jgi:hypothetical protein
MFIMAMLLDLGSICQTFGSIFRSGLFYQIHPAAKLTAKTCELA